MSEVITRADFDVAVESLWDLLGDFGDMNKWAGHTAGKCEADGSGVGALRTIVMPDGKKIVDRLEAETDFSYTYSIVTSPLPFTSYRATMSVEPFAEHKSRLTWHAVFEAKGLSDEEAIIFTENMYAQGIALMRATIEGQRNE